MDGRTHTLEVLQSLYEDLKLISYPRTDSRYFPDSEEMRQKVCDGVRSAHAWIRGPVRAASVDGHRRSGAGQSGSAARLDGDHPGLPDGARRAPEGEGHHSPLGAEGGQWRLCALPVPDRAGERGHRGLDSAGVKDKGRRQRPARHAQPDQGTGPRPD
ncbi:MAG: hypothetical protein IPL39_19115 [Opitutaceae bacterium]|nr:hypothetical protein [Opitutaceae bacterium]